MTTMLTCCLTSFVNISLFFYPTVGIKKNSKNFQPNAPKHNQRPKSSETDSKKPCTLKRFKWRICHYSL